MIPLTGWAEEPADAEVNSAAQKLLATATAEQAAGRYEKACPLFKRAYRTDPRVSTLFYNARCYDAWGRTATAVVVYDEYLAAFEALSPIEQREERDHEELASARRSDLEKKVPRIVVRLPDDAPAATVVYRKSADRGQRVVLALGVPLPIDPGEYTLEVAVQGRAPGFEKLRLGVGERREHIVTIPPEEAESLPAKVHEPLTPVPAYLPSLDRSISARRVAIYGLGSVGVLSVLGAGMAGILMWSQGETITQNCDPPDYRRCNDAGNAANQNAVIAGNTASVLLPVGLVAIGASVLLYLTEPAPTRFGGAQRPVQSSVTFGLGSAGVKLQW